MTRTLIIIVLYNGEKWLERCLGSVRVSGNDCLVLDNGSTDGSTEHVRQLFPEVKLIETGNNLGFGKANNIGMKYALEKGYDFVYLMNEDAWIAPDTITKLETAFDESKSFGILSPIQMSADTDKMDKRFEQHCGKALMEAGGKVKEVRFVMAAHWMISRECLKVTGGFSPAFTHNGEDDNYIHRARFHGFKTGIVPNVYAIHDRENRPTPLEAKIRLKYVGAVVKVSDPSSVLWWKLILEPVELLGISIYRQYPGLLKYIPQIIREYPKLIALRKESQKEGAFL